MSQASHKKISWLRRILYAGIALLLLGAMAAWVLYLKLDRSPSELLRYTERRLIGHNKLEFVALPVIHALRAEIERSVPAAPLSTLGKGVRSDSLPPQQYSPAGLPLPLEDTARSGAAPATSTIVSNEAELRQAIASAQAGQVIEILPGRYPITGPLKTGHAGTARAPIILRAKQPGSAKLEFQATQGIQIAHAYWIVENLSMRGICKADAECEHAFHIYGPAKNLVIRNNRIEDFNAHLKINGLNGEWPDNGLVQYNTLTNSHKRQTGLPITFIDLVGANGWQVSDNVINNFIKAEGNLISYGVFMKGGGMLGRIERNLVICTDKDISQPGSRVGISMGGGTTGADYCRDKRCITEHSQGIVANNIVAHCNDFGIDVNRSNQILIAHNTLINTSGIDVRQTVSSATIQGNLFDGLIRARDGALIGERDNKVGSLSGYFSKPDELELSWKAQPAAINTHEQIKTDFCLRKRGNTSLPGALTEQGPCSSTTSTP